MNDACREGDLEEDRVRAGSMFGSWGKRKDRATISWPERAAAGASGISRHSTSTTSSFNRSLPSQGSRLEAQGEASS